VLLCKVSTALAMQSSADEEEKVKIHEEKPRVSFVLGGVEVRREAKGAIFCLHILLGSNVAQGLKVCLYVALQ